MDLRELCREVTEESLATVTLNKEPTQPRTERLSNPENISGSPQSSKTWMKMWASLAHIGRLLWALWLPLQWPLGLESSLIFVLFLSPEIGVLSPPSETTLLSLIHLASQVCLLLCLLIYILLWFSHYDNLLIQVEGESLLCDDETSAQSIALETFTWLES